MPTDGCLSNESKETGRVKLIKIWPFLCSIGCTLTFSHYKELHKVWFMVVSAYYWHAHWVRSVIFILIITVILIFAAERELLRFLGSSLLLFFGSPRCCPCISGLLLLFLSLINGYYPRRPQSYASKADNWRWFGP